MPEQPQFMELLQPLQQQIEAIVNIREGNRASPYFNHLSAISESIGALAWITVPTKPHKHVEDMYGSAVYWGNRVLKEYKETSVLCSYRLKVNFMLTGAVQGPKTSRMDEIILSNHEGS